MLDTTHVKKRWIAHIRKQNMKIERSTVNRNRNQNISQNGFSIRGSGDQLDYTAPERLNRNYVGKQIGIR